MSLPELILSLPLEVVDPAAEETEVDDLATPEDAGIEVDEAELEVRSVEVVADGTGLGM